MATKMNIDPVQTMIQDICTEDNTSLATVYRVARLIVEDEEGLARLHRISNSAVELSSGLNLTPGQTVKLDLSETVSINAILNEKHDQRCHLTFEKRVNCAQLLRQLVAEARSSRSRPLRLTTPATRARVQSANGDHQLELKDISQRGMKVRHDGSFKPGLPLLIQLPNGRECRGVVRWTVDDRAGLQLIDTLSAHELGSTSSIRNRRK